MPIQVRFEYHTGVSNPVFQATRLMGSWDAHGKYCDSWTATPMERFRDDGGAIAYRTTVQFDDSQAGVEMRWGVSVDSEAGQGVWGIPVEREDKPESTERCKVFRLARGAHVERFDLTYLRQLGSNRLHSVKDHPGVRFAIWAPNAKAVELVFGDRKNGYVDAAGGGATSRPGQFPMQLDRATGVWSIDTASNAELGTFADCLGRVYLFRVTKDDGTFAWRTDLYSRCQIGEGAFDPVGKPYHGSHKNLDGTQSCSIVLDPDRVAAKFEQEIPAADSVAESEFWAQEFDPQRPLATSLDALVIYELHVNGLGFGKKGPGNLQDALEFVDHLVKLKVNAVELLPVSEYQGAVGWGYGTSHFFAIEHALGGADQFKHFVRKCHQNGIAVLLDVVYNHYPPNANRAEWCYDSDDPVKNVYYWYEGRPEDYPDFQQAVGPDRRLNGGYVDNFSSGWAPRFCEEKVRHLFIDSAVALMQEFHVDGFRVDQVTSIHREPALHATGKSCDRAKAWGVRFLREWTRTLKLLKPQVMLVAEDHSGWDKVTAPPDSGGLGFDAIWWADFYHTLCGDTGRAENLLKAAGYGTDGPLPMRRLGEIIDATSQMTVIYQESHDEAGNSKGDGGSWTSGRSLSVAVNGAPLTPETRRWAEARCRFAAGMTLLSGGVPMFFMGEEVGCVKPYRFDDFLKNREDLVGMRQSSGVKLFACFAGLIGLRVGERALRAGKSALLHTDDDRRVIAFQRCGAQDELVVVGTLSNQPLEGYTVPNVTPGQWHEIFSTDRREYGGSGSPRPESWTATDDGKLCLNIPSNCVLVLKRER